MLSLFMKLMVCGISFRRTVAFKEKPLHLLEEDSLHVRVGLIQKLYHFGGQVQLPPSTLWQLFPFPWKNKTINWF